MNPTDVSRHLFAYGTLVDPVCLEHVLGHKHLGERLAARLTGYRRVTRPSFPYPYIVAAEGAWVDGVLVMDLSACDLEALDRYEDVDSGMYRRQPVEVDVWGCGASPLRLAAHVYVAGPSTAQ